MEAIRTLQDEHNGVLYVLDQLDRAAGAAERGKPVPADVFADIQEFFTVFVDRCHHGKEETAVFPRLSAPAAALVRQLEAEHERGRDLAAAYRDAARSYMPGDAASGLRLATAAHDYAAFLRTHIDLENRELFPIIEQQLARDDQAVAEAFERIEIEKIGPGTHERLHDMIGGLAARITAWL
ncbi:MAG: hemerythrin domain-containing protein [Chloroflexi bacterium]|nr:hemerythrin domain-containing protein [Chloroflexota bacterium]